MPHIKGGTPTKLPVQSFYLTGGNLEQSRQAVALAKQYEGTFATVGCHPTRCSEFLEDPDLYFNKLLQLIQDNPEQVFTHYSGTHKTVE